MADARIRAMGRYGSNAVRPGRRRKKVRRAHSTPAAGLSYVQRRSLLPRSVTIALSVAALGLAWVGTAASTQTRAPAASPSRPAAAVPQVFATVRGLDLALPHDRPVAVAFHEASQRTALTLAPLGRLLANENPAKFSPEADRPGPAYRVLASRGRHWPATSAVDVVVRDGEAIRAPVTGRVVEVRRYPLYQRTLDWRIVIQPLDHPALQVVLIHLEEPAVKVGDRVLAGQTPLAIVRLLDFASQVDEATEQRLPHTHIEVKSAGAGQSPVVDPDAPAVEHDERGRPDGRPADR